MAKKIKCPRVGCDGIGIPVDIKKKFLFGKAAVGGALPGVAGTMSGVKGKNCKLTFVCLKCGKVFEKA